MDEALDDCLVGAGGSQGVHGGEVWPHQCGPEADGQVLTGHQVHLVVLTHPGKHGEIRNEIKWPQFTISLFQVPQEIVESNT